MFKFTRQRNWWKWQIQCIYPFWTFYKIDQTIFIDNNCSLNKAWKFPATNHFKYSKLLGFTEAFHLLTVPTNQILTPLQGRRKRVKLSLFLIHFVNIIFKGSNIKVVVWRSPVLLPSNRLLKNGAVRQTLITHPVAFQTKSPKHKSRKKHWSDKQSDTEG